MKDYEQLYYDAIYKIKKLEKENQNLKQELDLINNNSKKTIILRNEIVKAIKKYKEIERHVRKI